MDAMAYVADATDGRGNAAVAPSCQLGRDCGARTCLPVSECWMEIGWCHAMKGARGVGRAVPCVLVGASWQYREQPDPHAPLRCIAGLALLIFVHAAFVCTAARALVRLYTQYRVPPTPGLLLGLLVACVDRSCRQRHPLVECTGVQARQRSVHSRQSTRVAVGHGSEHALRRSRKKNIHMSTEYCTD